MFSAGTGCVRSGRGRRDRGGPPPRRRSDDGAIRRSGRASTWFGVAAVAPGRTVSVAFESAITVIGIVGIAFVAPDTCEVSPSKTHFPSSCDGVTSGFASRGSRTPPYAHWVFHHANL